MVYLAGTLAGLALCLGLGCFSLALFGAGLIALMGFFSRDKVLPSLSISLFLSTLYSTSVASSDITGIIVWLWCLYLGKMLYAPDSRGVFQVLWLPMLFWAFVSYSTNRTFQLQLLLPPLIACLPSPRIFQTTSLLRKVSPIILWFVVLVLTAIAIVGAPSRPNGVAYIENGKWAKTDQPFRLEGLDIASSYSYSEFLRLIGGHLTEPVALSEKERIAWIITPTKPFSDRELENLEKWVRQGGHLIAVSDHTDLFGHGRTMNSLLTRFGLGCTYTATITDKSRDPITYGDGGKFSILTGDTATGSSIWPLASTLEYRELAYYARPNFFGPLSPEGNTPFSRWVIMGCKSIGKGAVTLVTDSTVLSNFAVFQPGTADFIERAQSRPLMAALIKWLPWGVFISLLFGFLAGWRNPLPVCLLGFAALMIYQGPELQWTEFDQTWSGNPSLVLDNSNPRESLTTAFSISALSGKRPRWKDSPSKQDHGVWVSKTPPPNQNWKWLSPEKNKNAEVIPHDNRFNSLLDALGTEPVLGWQSIQESNKAFAGSIWTDDHMGTWWFDRGLSPARQSRFQSFLDWINSKPLPPNPEAYISKSTETSEFIFRMDGGGKEVIVNCPKPPSSDSPILIGDGISAQMVKIKGQDTLISVSPWMEYWQSPKIWTATEKRGEKKK
jgi:hypothetical protein